MTILAAPNAIISYFFFFLNEPATTEIYTLSLHDALPIRRMLTENTVRGSDRRVQYVGIDAYEQAGGPVLRDLFEHDDGGWLQDVALLDRLVTEKLKAEAETIAAEGWKWISVAVDFPYGHTGGLRELEGKSVDVTVADTSSTGSQEVTASLPGTVISVAGNPTEA